MALIKRLHSLLATSSRISISDERRAASGWDHPPLYSVLAPSFGAQDLVVAENVEKRTVGRSRHYVVLVRRRAR